MAKPPTGNRLDSGRSQAPVRTMVKTQADAFDDARKTDWLNPVALSILKDAVLTKKAKRVHLNGIEFKIEYGFEFPSYYETATESVRLTRVDGGFAPMGYVSLKRLRNFDFETAED